MIDRRYQAYPKYKDSGVEWLDEVPKEWSTVPLKYMALEKDSIFIDGNWIESKDLANNGIRYITTGNVGEGCYREQGVGYITGQKFKELGCTEVSVGDILISRLNAPIGRSCIVPDIGAKIVTSVDNVIFRPDPKFARKFIVYMLSSKDYFKHTSNLARGATMQRISRGLLGNIRVVIPTIKEQTQIANFLDHETAKIDTLIEKQQQLIALLMEKRQAVISHAVTKGLSPDVPMKNSGVEWLGEVPAHWRVLPLKRVVQLQRGHDLPTDSRVEGAFPVVSSGGVIARHSQYKGKGPGIVTGRYGTIGEFYYVEDNYWPLNTSLYSVKTYGNNVKYLWYLLKNMKHLFVLNSMKSAVPGVDRNDIHPEHVVVPGSFIEQQEIVDYLNGRMQEINDTEAKVKDGIKLLQERRTALISAAVTGKIDVRNWQPPTNYQNSPETQ